MRSIDSLGEVLRPHGRTHTTVWVRSDVLTQTVVEAKETVDDSLAEVE